MIFNDYHLKCYRLNDTLSLAAGASEGRFGVGISDNLFSIKKKSFGLLWFNLPVNYLGKN